MLTKKCRSYWRSSGDRLISKEELKDFPVDKLQQAYRKYSRENIYNYDEHVKLAEDLDKDGKLPATFMVVAPGSWNNLEVWDDINRMRTLNTTQSRRRAQMHVCPLQLDIVERIINRYSNEEDVVYDPFGGLMTVPMTAVKMHRFGVRPEDLIYQDAPAAENNISVKVTNKEPLGAETHVFVQIQNTKVVAKCHPSVNPKLGDTVNFVPRIDKCKFFDFDTEINICEPEIEKTW